MKGATMRMSKDEEVRLVNEVRDKIKHICDMHYADAHNGNRCGNFPVKLIAFLAYAAGLGLEHVGPFSVVLADQIADELERAHPEEQAK
jgi:hypothetical protein